MPAIPGWPGNGSNLSACSGPHGLGAECLRLGNLISLRLPSAPTGALRSVRRDAKGGRDEYDPRLPQ